MSQVMPQLQVLNYILQTKDSSLIVLNNLNESYFSVYPKEFNFIKTHLDRYGNVCDLETFLDTFKDFTVIQVNESPDYLIKALLDDYKSRSMVVTFNNIQKLVSENRLDEAVRLYKDSAEDLNKVGVSMKCIDIIKDTSRFDSYIERTRDFNKYFISTGFPELDEIIGGFDRHEELAIVVARPGVGKSWLGLKFAVEAAKKGLTVGIYSGEMSEEKVGTRADTLIGHINNSAVVHGNISIANEYEDYFKTLKDKVPGSIKVLTPAMINGIADTNALRAFIEKEHLDMLVVDQLSLVEEKRGHSIPEKIAFVIQELKKIQVVKQIPIVAISQQNRTKNEDGLDLTQIAGSDEVGRFGTIVIFLEKKDDILKMHLTKIRDNSSGKTLSYNVNINTGQFIYLPSEKDGLGGAVDNKYAERYQKKDEGAY